MRLFNILCDRTVSLCGGGYKSLIINRIIAILALYFLFVSVFPTETRASSLPESDNDTIRIQKSLKISIYIDPPYYCDGGTSVGAAVGTGAENASGEKPVEEEYELKPVFALRSNLLLPLMNVGAQIPLGNRFSIGLDWYYPFIYRHWSPYLDQTNCFQALGPGADFRIYLGKKHRKGRENWQYRLSGHSIGLNGMCGRYDVEWQFHGEQARFWCAGIDYMWSARIGKRKRMRLDLSVGVGYFQSRAVEYQVFRPGGLAYKTGRILEHTWMGPTKATVSLVIPIHAKVEKRREVNE